MELNLSAADMKTLAGLVAAELSEPLLYSVAAAAKLLDLSEPSVHRLVKEGKLSPFTGHGMQRTQFTRAELERFVAGESPGGEVAAPAESYRIVDLNGGELTYDGESAFPNVRDYLARIFAALDGGTTPPTPPPTQ